MATERADDDKVVSGDAPSATDAPASGAPIDTRRESQDGRLEWTASDARGPLVTADEKRAEPGEPSEPRLQETPTTAETVPTEERAGPVSAESTTTATPAAEHPISNEGAEPSRAAAPATSVPADGPPQKRSLLPLAAGIIIGALIGAGSAAIVYENQSGTSTPDPMVASLAARVDAVEKRSTPSADASWKGAVADLDGKLAALEKRTGATPHAASSPAVDLTPLQQKMTALQASLDALKAQSAANQDLAARIAALQGMLSGVQTKVAALQGDIAATKTASSTNEASIASVAGQQKLLSGKISMPGLAVVADSLVQQVDQGQPYAVQIDALAALGADPAKIAVLRQNAETGVPSAKTLAAKFEPLAEPIAAFAHKAPPNAGFVDRLKSGMFSMVSIRNVDDTSGTDLPSRVARIQADLAHDDLSDALATWDGLPDDAKAKGEAWGALVKTSVEAMNAARALQHDAIVALGAKKS